MMHQLVLPLPCNVHISVMTECRQCRMYGYRCALARDNVKGNRNEHKASS